jgi:hypothetical protein
MKDANPPNAPWRKIKVSQLAGGYLSFHYSDDLSSLPVRWVTKVRDNKSDPNIETATYGLFSTCSPNMRKGVVKKGIRSIFFCTRRGGERCLTGFYHVGWYTQGPLGAGDYCLAADRIHFVEHPISLVAVDKELGTKISKRFRGMRCLSPKECNELESLLLKQPDFTHRYLQEIDRLERFNLRYTGYRYVSWRQDRKFDWQYGAEYLKPTARAGPGVHNSSASDSWTCSSCRTNVKNKALLKRCPHCGGLATLKPA